MKKNTSKTELVNAINNRAGAPIASERMTREQLNNLLHVIERTQTALDKASKASKASKPKSTPKSVTTKDEQPKRKLRRIANKRDFLALIESLKAAGIEEKKIEVQQQTLWVNSPNKAQRETLKRLGFIGNRNPRANGKPNGMFAKLEKGKTYDMRKWYKAA